MLWQHILYYNGNEIILECSMLWIAFGIFQLYLLSVGIHAEQDTSNDSSKSTHDSQR